MARIYVSVPRLLPPKNPGTPQLQLECNGKGSVAPYKSQICSRRQRFVELPRREESSHLLLSCPCVQVLYMIYEHFHLHNCQKCSF